MTVKREPFEGWAILELMGHRRLAGYVSEVELAGHGMLRLDVPDHPFVDGGAEDAPRDVVATQLYSPTALYCLTPTTEELARGLAQRTKPAPVHRYELPAPPPPPPPAASDEPVPRCDTCGHPLADHNEVDAETGCVACSITLCDCPAYDGIPF